MRIRGKTAGYIGVSTNEQVISALSLDAQRQKVQAQAELSDLELVAILEDANESASTSPAAAKTYRYRLSAQARRSAPTAAKT